MNFSNIEDAIYFPSAATATSGAKYCGLNTKNGTQSMYLERSLAARIFSEINEAIFQGNFTAKIAFFLDKDKSIRIRNQIGKSLENISELLRQKGYVVFVRELEDGFAVSVNFYNA